MKKTKVFRANLDDVERLSYGKGAKKQRGTGSRYVCHRLNKDERKLYDLAKQASYLTLRGTGYRKERKGSPLCNTFRQRCDALDEICVIIEKRASIDTVMIDFSTLRVKDDTPYVLQVLDNVFKAKFPDLYDMVMKDADGDMDVSTIIKGNINWDSVKTLPIWGVDERLIIVPCERDTAKALAIDVIKESYNFTEIIESNESDEIAEEVTRTVVTRDSAADEHESDDDSIDWNDI